MIGKRKVVLVGTGFVGMSMAYALVAEGLESGVNELVLIDILKDKVIGEAMDLSHGLPCTSSHMRITAGDYNDCSDADIVVITAGLNQKPGQTRLELSEANAKIMKDITNQVINSGFKGIFVIASNPVDLMTKVVQEVSKFPTNKVIGSGTALDTARLRYMLGGYFNISDKNMHAYIMGEHGDSSFVPWEHAYVGCKKVIDILKDAKKDLSDLDKIYTEVRDAAYEIINKKKATYYGIGLSLNHLVHSILKDENLIMTVSAHQNGEYGQEGLYIGVPAIVGSQGIKEIIQLPLNEVDQNKFDTSCTTLKQIIKDSINELL